MQAILFNFSKRLNSTKRPVDAEGTEVTVSIRQNVPKGQSSAQSGTETFLSHPTIWVQGDYTDYNYMKFKGRYYFIRDIQLTINNATVIYGEIDVLATYKDDIQSTTAKVIYSSSSYNLNIDDIRNHATENATVAINSTPFPFAFTTEGTFLLTVQGGARMSTTYALTGSELEALIAQLNDSFQQIMYPGLDAYSQATSPSQAIQALQQLFADIGQYLVDGVVQYYTSAAEAVLDLKWSPLAIDEFTAHSALPWEVKLGLYTVHGVYAKVVSGQVHSYPSTTLAIPHQSDYYSKGKRLSSYAIYIPFCGMYDLPNDAIYNKSQISVELSLDCSTGDIAGEVFVIGDDGHNFKIMPIAGCCSCSLMHSNYNKDTFMSVLQTGIAAIAMAPSLGMGNAISKQIAMTSEVRLISQVDKPHVITGGTISSAIGFASGRAIEVVSITKTLADSKTAIRQVEGLPLYRTVSLSSLSGYCRCENASVESGALEAFKQEINQFLNSGFFIE